MTTYKTKGPLLSCSMRSEFALHTTFNREASLEQQHPGKMALHFFNILLFSLILKGAVSNPNIGQEDTCVYSFQVPRQESHAACSDSVILDQQLLKTMVLSLQQQFSQIHDQQQNVQRQVGQLHEHFLKNATNTVVEQVLSLQQQVIQLQDRLMDAQKLADEMQDYRETAEEQFQLLAYNQSSTEKGMQSLQGLVESVQESKWV